MTTTTACVTGCTLRDQHHDDCTHEACRGCLPRAADHGLLCARCFGALLDGLALVPVMLDHLTVMGRLAGDAHAKPLTDDPPTHGDPAHGTVLPAATLAADELRRLVAAWADVARETHPANLRGHRARPWHGDAATWLLSHAAWAARQDWVDDLRTELAQTLATLRARWPLPDDVEHDRAVPAVPCPRCDVVALRYYPPAHFRQPFAVACMDCGRLFTEDEWLRFSALVVAPQRRTA